MAGGSGERFYPASRLRKPKQLLRLVSDSATMIEEAVARIEPLIPAQHIFVITSELLQNPIREVLPTIPPENIIAEPAKKNTAPCLALACQYIADRYRALGYSLHEISTAVLTADHFMRPADSFRSTVETALLHAEQEGNLVTIGIIPSRPETGYGYIQIDKNDKAAVKKVVAFKEKPDRETALQYVNDESYYWNSGMFFWRLDAFFQELSIHAPTINGLCQQLENVLHNATNNIVEGAPIGTRDIFELMPSISIDYALMEKSLRIRLVPSTFSWDDVGSWDALFRTKICDENGNVLLGDVISLDSKNSIIVNEQSNNRVIACVGIEDTVIVGTDDITVICPVDQVQNVKKVVENLRSQNKQEYL